MDLHQYLHALRRYWWAIALPVALGVALGAFVYSRADSEFRASLTFFVNTTGEEGTSTALQADEFAQRRVNSYLQLLSTDRLADKVIEETGLDLTSGQVKAMMGADADVETVLLTATVTSESRILVEQVGDAVATEFVELVDEVENLPGRPAAVSLELVSGPNVAELPPRRSLIVGVPTVLGLGLGLVLAWLLELRDNTIRSEAQLRALEVGPTLGIIPFDRRLRESVQGRHRTGSSAGMESFRQLRTNLEFIDVSSPVRLLVVTSPVAQEGKTTTCVNLALALVATRKKVLLVEGDLRRPTLHDNFAVRKGVGLSDVIIGRAEIDAALWPTRFDRLTLLDSGQLPPNPSELLGSDAMVQLLGRLRDRFDIVIINSPPLLPVTDAAVLSAHADGVLVVVRAGKTTRQQLLLATQSLTTVGARVIGTVLNRTAPHKGAGYTAYWRTGPREPGRPPHPEITAAGGEARIPEPIEGTNGDREAASLKGAYRE